MSQHKTSAYYALIEAMIADQVSIWGQQGVTIADTVEGLHVDDADSIWVIGDGRDVAGALAEAYVEQFGDAAAASLQQVAYQYRTDVDLPPILEH